MKIAILSRNTRLYSTKRLVEAARVRGHVVRVFDPLRCYVRIAPGASSIRFKGKEVRDIDAVIPRIGTSSTFYGTAGFLSRRRLLSPKERSTLTSAGIGSGSGSKVTI